MVKKSDVVLATGRRKCAVARVRLTPGSGNVVVNGKPMAEYFTSESLCGFVNQVFTVSETHHIPKVMFYLFQNSMNRLSTPKYKICQDLLDYLPPHS